MNKTQLGLSENMYAALLFLLGLTGIFPVIVLTVVAFVMHESEYIKKTALQSVGLLLLVAVTSYALLLLHAAAGTLLTPVFGLFPHTWSGTADTVYNKLKSLLYLLQNLFIFIFTYMAYKQKPVRIPFVDKLIDRCM